MFNGSNCDRKSQLSGKLIEPLNPRGTTTSEREDRHYIYIKLIFI